MTMEQLSIKYLGDISSTELSEIAIRFKSFLLTRTEDVIEWLTSPYVGVHSIVFRDSDLQRFFFELDIDFKGFRKDVITTLGDQASYKVLSNPFNVIMMLIAYKVKDDEEAFRAAIEVTYFRFATSSYSVYFSPPFDVGTAKEIYHNTYNQALIKRFDNNIGVMHHVSANCYSNPTLSKKFTKPNIDNIKYILSDISGTVRNLNKLSYKVKNREEGASHSASSSITSFDGEESVTIVEDEHVQITSALKQLASTGDLKNRRIIQLVCATYSDKLHPDYLEEAIEALESYGKSDKDEFYDSLVSAFISYLSKSNYYPPYDKSFTNYIATARGYLSSSKTTDEALLKAKTFAALNIAPKLSVKRTSILVSNALLIYCFTLAVYRDKL